MCYHIRSSCQALYDIELHPNLRSQPSYFMSIILKGSSGIFDIFHVKHCLLIYSVLYSSIMHLSKKGRKFIV